LQLVECVPNFSEGRRQEVVEAIAKAVRSVAGVTLLDVESNEDHNRSVITFVGPPGQVREAALAASAKAVELIDLNRHKGEHPRMGAVDVVPFVPLSGVTMEDCVRLAREFGQELGEKLQVPVYLYEEAATRPERRNLADVRAGEFEGLRDEIGKKPERKPDFGPEKIHPTAGATAVGAREILIAYNVNLGTSDLNIAKKIAHELRSKDGGLSYVKALGFDLKERGLVQVSMNLTNYRKSEMFKAFELVKLFADRFGVPVVGSEIVGLTPVDALSDTAEFYLKLENFSRDQVLENKLYAGSHADLTGLSLEAFSDEIASKKATPGGGSVSAYMAAMAASLLSMVSKITLGKKESAPVEKLEKAITRGEELRLRLLRLVEDDAKAFDSVMKAYRIPKSETEARQKAIQEATVKAAEVPLGTLDNSVQVMLLAREVAEVVSLNTISDVATAVAAAKGAVEGAASNVLINLESLSDEKLVEKISTKVNELKSETLRLETEIARLVYSRSKKAKRSEKPSAPA
jgi:glutamate formiminotransferase / formiminotetrahydrofolate cyclodeaminase